MVLESLIINIWGKSQKIGTFLNIVKKNKMKKQDFSIYGRNKRGKKALCETCTKNNWYCPVRPRYYQCKSYIKKEKEVINGNNR